MKYAIVALPLCLLTVACVTMDTASVEDRTLPFGCDDVVVVGRVKNSGFSPVQRDTDFIGHGSASAAITVRKVVRGPELPQIIPVHYFAHTYMREDRDFMLVLRKSQNGAFGIESGQLMSVRPRLAARCQ